jgi:tetratricopeptide (TPR) repeat protein
VLPAGADRQDGLVDLGRWRRRTGGEESMSALQAEYRRACDAEDADAEVLILTRITELYPDAAWAWFDLGLRAKWARNWALAAELNKRALELEGDGRENPSAWNLGIAATALGDWPTARRAWRAYGVELSPASEDEPINDDLGLTPVRLNPEPRYPGESELIIDGATHQSEVVWCQRLCPARAVIRNVPLPESGHRFGDVVLHDGEPVGERPLGNSTRSVFNELARLERSPMPTLEVEIVAPDQADVDALLEVFLDRDLGAEDWTTSFRMLCRACSEGSPDDGHAHEVEEPPAGAERRVGVAAPFEVADEIIDAWLLGSPDRDRGPLTLMV